MTKRSAFARATFPLAYVGRGLVRLGVYWTPVWLPVLLLTQVTLLGLKPTLEERDRLRGEESVVEARYGAALEEWTELDAVFMAWQDPVYRERRRRHERRGEEPEY